MRRRIPPDPHAYHREYGSWRHPADKHVPPQIEPPYGRPKFPDLTAGDYLAVGLVCLPLFALGALWRVLSRDLFSAGRLLR